MDELNSGLVWDEGGWELISSSRNMLWRVLQAFLKKSNLEVLELVGHWVPAEGVGEKDELYFDLYFREFATDIEEGLGVKWEWKESRFGSWGPEEWILETRLSWTAKRGGKLEWTGAL